MPIDRAESKRLIAKTVHDVVDKLKVKLDHLNRFADDDDWSFVIKTHALLEASLWQAIIARLGDDRVAPIIGRLALSNDAMGKLAVGRALNVITPPQVQFIKRIASLRNDLVHDLDQCDFAFRAYIDALNASDKHNWTRTVTWFVADGSPSSASGAIWPPDTRRSLFGLAAFGSSVRCLSSQRRLREFGWGTRRHCVRAMSFSSL